MATNAPNANRRQPDCFEKKKKQTKKWTNETS